MLSNNVFSLFFFGGGGPVLQIPTHTDDRLGTDKWSAGPGFVALAMPGKWVVGVL